jgi:hypothetical protein
MEAQGRGPDRTLVHMTPKEVQGLQAIAMAHGGSLTINPVTGLPEAGFLDKFLPAIAGFALNAFAPGVGTAVGSMFGLGSAAGTALTVGGISGLASGSLEKGIMAGLGAYGGAAVGEGLGNMGQTANMKEAYDAAAASGMDSSDSFMASLDKAQPDVSKGIAAAANAPKDFLKDNKYALAALAAPALMGSQGKEPAALPSSGYIRTMKRDPVTGEIYQESATPTGEWGGRPTGTYGGVARMAEGGQIDDSLANIRQNMSQGRLSNIGVGDDPFAQVAYDTRTDSQKSFDYLMGRPGATNPMLFPRTTGAGPTLPIDYETRTGGKYVYDRATNSYTWVPNATSGLPATGGPGSAESSGGGSDPNQGPKTDWGGILGDPSLTGKDWSELTPEQQDKASGIVDPYGIGKGISALVQNSLIGKVATGIGNIFSGKTKDGGYDLGFNQDALGTGRGTQSEGKQGEDAAGKAAPGMQAQQQAEAEKGFEATKDQTAINAALEGARPDPREPSTMFSGVPSSRSLGMPSFSSPYGPSFGDMTQVADVAAAMGSMQDAMNADVAAAQAQAAADQADANQGAAVGGDQGSISDQSGANTGGYDTGYGTGDTSGGFGGGEYAQGGIAALAYGGLGSLGGYSDGGRLLRGPGNGTSDSIPATIGNKRPARLADGEFVIPSRIVSELGNGSTEAGARQLYAMMDRIQAARRKTVGKDKVAFDAKARKHLPA